MCSYSRCRLRDKWVKWNWINLQWNYCTIHSENINSECYLISSRIYIHNVCTEKSSHDTDRAFVLSHKAALHSLSTYFISHTLPKYFSTFTPVFLHMFPNTNALCQCWCHDHQTSQKILPALKPPCPIWQRWMHIHHKQLQNCMISGFQYGVNETHTVTEFYAAQIKLPFCA